MQLHLLEWCDLGLGVSIHNKEAVHFGAGESSSSELRFEVDFRTMKKGILDCLI